MMMSEFIERTGFQPTAEEYAKIEEAYYDFNGDKNEFCLEFVAKGGEKKIYEARATEIERLKGKIVELEKMFKADAEKKEQRITYLQTELDRELEWKPYEFPNNISQADYTRLAECVPSGSARYMTDDEALDWICSEFGFDRSKITILHDIEGQEINRHNHIRATKERIDRRPIYCATDYHYIRFNAGCGEWQWEVWNGQMRPFWN